MKKDKNAKKLEKCDIASRFALKYGPLNTKIMTEKKISEIANEHMSCTTIRSQVSSKNIKWYIYNKITVDDPIWNADFIAGLTKTGKVYWSKKVFPTFKWWGSPILIEILNNCPYYGRVKSDEQSKKQKHEHCWIQVPALYLKPSYDSLSYIAGLLSTGRLRVYKGETYALYQYSVMEELEKLGIPLEIEVQDTFRRRPLVSPFWGALFTKYMPECCQSYWLDIKNPYRGLEYASILWLTYADHKIVRGGLPYLKSRRTIMYRFKNENGTLKQLQKLRVKYNLVKLDKRFKECIITWFKDI